jgi:opacity protein-like surface antigen
MEVTMRRSAIPGLTGTLMLLAAHTASAQAPPVKLELTPFAGGALFLSELPSAFQLDTDFGGTTTLTGVEFDNALVFGGRAGLRIADRFGIGASVLYSPLTYSTSTATGQDGGLYAYGADFSYHAIDLSERIAPFIVAGVGAKSYDFEGADLKTDFMWNAGAGLDVALTRNVGIRFEARDYMSLFDPMIDGLDEELQHDIVLSAGLSFIFGPQPGRTASARSQR